jgi:nitrate/TMAO reductase-like tetraheme cytochrome c subunit
MNEESLRKVLPVPSLLRNWLSLVGLLTVLASLFAFLLLFFLDLLAHTANPYLGVLTYLVAPLFTGIGLCLTLLGAWWERRALRKAGSPEIPVVINLSRLRDRRILAIFVAGGVVLLFLTAMGSYHSYHFTESTTFCGQACHTVMEPEMVTYGHSAHARVACTACHIGPGATWFVRSKLSGTYQVYATLFNKYPRPIATPIKNLRPAQETCEQCHWPRKFSGDVVRTFRHFLSDEKNTEYSLRMLLRVGGGDPSRGPAGGIHWHMSVANKVEYVAEDETRQKIPWVRLTDSQGVVTEYRVPDFTNEVSAAAIRTMDCMDCHNRPAHIYEAPNDAVDLAISLGQIDPALPFVRSNLTAVLTASYQTEQEATQKIATELANRYPDRASIRPVIDVAQRIYRDNFFPEMKANWLVYPDNIGHKNWSGCFRCHDDRHKTADGKQTIVFRDCNRCHLILAQGSGAELEQLTPSGQPFQHPGEEYDPEFKCHDCHTGGP